MNIKNVVFIYLRYIVLCDKDIFYNFIKYNLYEVIKLEKILGKMRLK